MNKLKSLSEHSYSLCLALRESQAYRWETIYEWLHLAASIKSVSVDTLQYEESLGWCRDADEFCISQEKLYQRFATKLSVFSFVWGALEATIDTFIKCKELPPTMHTVIPRGKRRKLGKIAGASKFISLHFKDRMLITPYREEIARFLRSSRRSGGFDKISNRLREMKNIVGYEGSGLYLVYVLRNDFAHGSLHFPEPDFDNQPYSPHEALIGHATRIVLLSIQMLLATRYDHQACEIENPFVSRLDPELIEMRHLLRTLHYVINASGAPTLFDGEG